VSSELSELFALFHFISALAPRRGKGGIQGY